MFSDGSLSCGMNQNRCGLARPRPTIPSPSEHGDHKQVERGVAGRCKAQGGCPPAPIIQVPQKLFFLPCPRKAKSLSAESSLRRAGDCSRLHSVSPLYDITSLGRMACAYFCAEADVSPTLSWPMPWGFVCLRGSCARLHQRCGSAVQSPHSRCVARVAGLCTVMCIANADSH